MDGIDVVRALKVQSPDTAALMLTVFEDDAVLRRSMQAGARGYVVKSTLNELVTGIKLVANGGMYIHPTMMPALVRGLLADAPPAPPAEDNPPAELSPLTPREQEVLQKLALGYVNREIAAELFISPRTVENHRKQIFEKLQLKSRADLVRYAREHHLL